MGKKTNQNAHLNAHEIQVMQLSIPSIDQLNEAEQYNLIASIPPCVSYFKAQERESVVGVHYDPMSHILSLGVHIKEKKVIKQEFDT